MLQGRFEPQQITAGAGTDVQCCTAGLGSARGVAAALRGRAGWGAPL